MKRSVHKISMADIYAINSSRKTGLTHFLSTDEIELFDNNGTFLLANFEEARLVAELIWQIIGDNDDQPET